MTVFDDALNSASREIGPHQLTVNWRETDNLDVATNRDSLSNFTQHFAGAMTVAHSMDDGLPSPVTMTTSADASGILTADLNGRHGLALGTAGIRSTGATNWNSGAATTVIAGTIPSGTLPGDYLISAVLVSDSTAAVSQANWDPRANWSYLGTVSDGTLSMQLYAARRYSTVRTPLALTSSKPVNYMVTTIALWAQTLAGVPLDYRVNQAALVAETSVSTTAAHAVGSSFANRGFQVAFWGAATATGTWTPGGSQTTTLGNPNANGIEVTVTSSGATLLNSGMYTAAASSAVATNVATMAAVSLEPYERPEMDARQFFSPLNTFSPIFGFDRDTATVLAQLRVKTSTGPVDTTVFSGQMQGLPIKGRQAELDAVSRTRIRMNRTVAPPIVGATREGLTTDWFVTWLAARASQFVGPAPNRYTRYWAPMHGSVHAHWDAPDSYNYMTFLEVASPLTLQGYTYPPYEPNGPFLTAMNAQQTATRTEVININPRSIWKMTDSPFPHVVEAGGPILADLQSQANSKGRMCFWIRADPAQTAPTYISAGDDYLFNATLYTLSPDGSSFLGYVRMWIDSNNRRANIQMGSDAAGYTTIGYSAAGVLPTDGTWHMIGFYWDFAAGTGKVVHNGTELSSSSWAVNGNNVVTQLAATDAQARSRNDVLTFTAQSHLPLAEFMLDSGNPYPGSSIWADYYPANALPLPGASATIRRARLGMLAIATANAINVWDTLTEIAQSSLAAYRINELDNLEFLTSTWFGETPQRTVQAAQSTRTNAADPDLSIDPSKSRNVVNLQFIETRVDTTFQPILVWTTSVTIPAGTSYISFPLDIPAVEIHGSLDLTGTNYQIKNLTSTEITTPTLPTDRHYITMNSKADATGTVLSELSVVASFYDVQAQSVTIKFVNKTAKAAYLVNPQNGTIPFMQLLGYGVHEADGYITVRDPVSVLVRGEKSLDSQMPWVQGRVGAQQIASQLLATISSPRAELGINVLGDPRRKPGQLISVVDPDGTNIAGNWRIYSVTHLGDGAKYTQDLQLVQVFPGAVWDGMDGWDNAVWS